MSKAAVRHAWMFRTAAFVFLGFGLIWLWRFGLTDYHPEQRPYGLAAGVLALLLGISLWRLKRFAIGASAVATGIIGISAALFAPTTKGPAILFLAGLAITCILYAVLAVRELTRATDSVFGSRAP
jgi:peptidoglycan/LPS O-acetylase OafA/YrhL